MGDMISVEGIDIISPIKLREGGVAMLEAERTNQNRVKEGIDFRSPLLIIRARELVIL